MTSIDVLKEELFVSSSKDEVMVAQVDLVRKRLNFHQEVTTQPLAKKRRTGDWKDSIFTEQPSSTSDPTSPLANLEPWNSSSQHGETWNPSSLNDDPGNTYSLNDEPWNLSSQNQKPLNLSTPTTKVKFPGWTQKQVGGSGRRPYSRSCVTILSWWYKHLSYLSTPEMEIVAHLTNLSKHQVKVWWQNRRHSQRARAADTVGQLTAMLPCLPVQSAPNPHSKDREGLFEYLLQFFCLQVAPAIHFSQASAFVNFLS